MLLLFEPMSFFGTARRAHQSGARCLFFFETLAAVNFQNRLLEHQEDRLYFFNMLKVTYLFSTS